jgi:TRAP-type C4-dicarboxylate transport system permease small subunit
MENKRTAIPLHGRIVTALPSKAKSSPHLIFCFVLVLYFCITYYSLYARYIFFEMREPHGSASFIQAVWSIFNGSPFTITTQEHWVDYFPYNLLSDQLYFTLALFSPLSLVTSSEGENGSHL